MTGDEEIWKAISPVMTEVTFLGGTEDGLSRRVWATQEIVVPVQSEPAMTPEEIKRADLTKLLWAPAHRPARQVYKLSARGSVPRTALYVLDRVEDP